MSLVNYAQLSLPPGVFMGDGVPIGTVIPFIAAATPVGWLACDGQAVSRTVYAELYALIGTQFGEGDGVETFNLPNLTGRFLEGDTTAGVLKEAGLPNIEGTLEHVPGFTLKSNGALNIKFLSSANVYDTGNNALPSQISFDASKSNAVYGNSATVQPASMTVRWLIKAAVNTSAYAGINKRDLVTTSGVYTAPVTGWYTIVLKGGGGGGGCGYNDGTNFYGGGGGGEGGVTVTYAYLTANDQINIVIGAGGAGASGNAYTAAYSGQSGGNTTITFNNTVFTAGGGQGGFAYLNGGPGGTGTVVGSPGSSSGQMKANGAVGGSGGGNGGGVVYTFGWGTTTLANGKQGGGGAGGYSALSHKGGNGGDGYVEFLYFDPNLRP